MLLLHNFSKTTVASLPPEVLERIFFYVGDIFLYFEVAQRPNNRHRALIPHNNGPGFILEEAIKRHHKLLLQWLLQENPFPKDYLLASAAIYGDVETLQYITSLIGDNYTEYDTPAKLFCIAQGRMGQLEYLYQNNPTFNGLRTYVSRYIVAGIHNSKEICSWYVKNKPTTYMITEVDLIQGYLQNDDTTGASEYIDPNDLTSLMRALSVIRFGKEETFRWLIATYPDEEVLIFVANACARIGYIDTLEILFNEPYNIHVEYNFFVAIPNLAVAQVLHKYAYKQNTISNRLNGDMLQKNGPHFETYRTPDNYYTLLRKFTQSEDCIQRRHHSHFLERPSTEVLMFLVDLADVASNVKELNIYVRYAIEYGHLELLRKLRPHMREQDVNTLSWQIELGMLNMYSSSSSAMVEYLLEWEIAQTKDVDTLIPNFDLKLIRKLVEKKRVTDQNDMLIEWNSETQDTLQKKMLKKIGGGFNPIHFENREALLEMAHSAYAGLYEQYGFSKIDFGNSKVAYNTHHLMRYLTHVATGISQHVSAGDKIIRMIEQSLTMVNVHLLLMELTNNSRNLPKAYDQY